MSYKEIIEQKKREREDSLTSANNNKNDESFNSDYFGIENLRNIPACLDLRFSDGNCQAVPYSLFTSIEYSTDKGIIIKSSLSKITISGRNLKFLYNYLVTFRVRYIQSNLGMDVGENNLIVTEIEIQNLVN